MSESTTDAGRGNLTQPSHPIHLPVIKSLELNGYLLYPGTPERPGLTHSFPPGVNVVVGINGVGKTTLLLILYRMLTGARDLPGGIELGNARRRLIEADTGIFADRVPDRGREAVATLHVSIGSQTIAIKRSLRNLQLLELQVVDEPSVGSGAGELEDQYKVAICHMVGVADFFDFVLLLKYLTFYFEDRRSLLWDKWAQTEVLQILLLPYALQTEYRKQLGIAQSADSEARNTNTVLERERKRLAKVLRESATSQPRDLSELRALVQELTLQHNQVTTRKTELAATRVARRRLVEQLRNDIERLSQEERSVRERALAGMFPQLTDFGAFALGNITSSRGCVVCGNTDVAALAKAHEHLLKTLACPVCNANPAEQEAKVLPATTDEAGPALTRLSAQRQLSVKALHDAEIIAEEAQIEYVQILEAGYRIDDELSNASEQLRIAEAFASRTQPATIAEHHDRVRVLEDSVAESLRDKAAAEQILSPIVQILAARAAEFRSTLISKFQEYIQGFLAETCQLEYRTEARRVGTGNTVPMQFPEFYVVMTSGVFRQSGTPREDSASVSESQQEFVELAFRMSVLAAMAKGSRCSLVIDTPESSLDAVFIPKAGTVLNEFARMPGEVANTVIATSNLNGTEMIPALLGKVTSDVSTTAQRVLNLLQFAAESAALRAYRQEYELKLTEALVRVSEGPSPKAPSS